MCNLSDIQDSPKITKNQGAELKKSCKFISSN